MTIDTKYNLGQKVWPIWSIRKEIVSDCQGCGGEGQISLSGESFQCPKCWGDGTTISFEPDRWHVKTPSKIGMVKAEFYKNSKHGTDHVCYMIESTGIGSGQNWYEEYLFGSEKEAQEECDKRNTK